MPLQASAPGETAERWRYADGAGEIGLIRDVRVGPDGLIYVLTDGPDHAVLRIAPAPAS